MASHYFFFFFFFFGGGGGGGGLELHIGSNVRYLEGLRELTTSFKLHAFFMTYLYQPFFFK